MTVELLQHFWQAEDGQDLIEYSLLLALIALVAVTILSQVGTSVKTIWSNINTQLSTAGG